MCSILDVWQDSEKTNAQVSELCFIVLIFFEKELIKKVAYPKQKQEEKILNARSLVIMQRQSTLILC